MRKMSIAFAFATAFVLFVSAPALAGAEYVMKVGNVSASDGPYTLAMLEMEKLVEKYSNGRIDYQVYDNAQLGGERDLMEAVGMGSVQGCVIASAPAAAFKSNFFVFDFPYLITDIEKAWKVFDDPKVGGAILKELEDIGIKGMNFWANGSYHHINNKRPLRHPSDMKGLKMRCMENEIYIAIYTTLGATPSPMSVPDFSTAIRQGTVDGTNNAYVNIYQYKWQESLRYMTETFATYSPAVFLVSKEWFDALPADLQDVVVRAEREACLWERELSARRTNELKEIMKKEGLQIIEDINLQEWIEATKPVHEQFKDRVNYEYVQAFIDVRDGK